MHRFILLPEKTRGGLKKSKLKMQQLAEFQTISETAEFRASSSATEKTFGKVEAKRKSVSLRAGLAEWADAVCQYIYISRSTLALLQVVLQEKGEKKTIFTVQLHCSYGCGSPTPSLSRTDRTSCDMPKLRERSE